MISQLIMNATASRAAVTMSIEAMRIVRNI